VNLPVIVLAPVNLQVPTRMLTLDASQSFSPSGSPLTFSWTSNQAVSIANASTATPIITFSGPGTFQVQLTVTDASGVQSSVLLPFTFVGP
jgi:PKD repeat protein